MDFVVGHPRSGTNFFAHLLNSAGEVVCRHEHLARLTNFVLVTLATAYYEGRCDADCIKSLIRAYKLGLLIHADSNIQNYGLEPRIRVDSNWKLSWILPPLLEEYPYARFVHLVRDPRENVLACCNLDYYGDALIHSDFMKDKPILAEWYKAMPRINRPDWDRLSQFERNCAFWTETHRLILDALSARDEYLLVRMEDLQRDDMCVARVFEFLELPMPSQDGLARARTKRSNTKNREKEAVQRLKADLLPRYAEWPARERQILQRLCGEMAHKLQYEI